MPKLDADMLSAALVGYQHQLKEIDAKIADIRKALAGHKASFALRDGGSRGEVPGPVTKRMGRKMSAAARRRIAAAQRLRWIEYRKKKQKVV
jgi:hypothetical protein